MPTIRVDDEVFDGLKKLAEPLVDTPSAVIRRLLEAHGVLRKKAERPSPKAPASRPARERTPQSVYEANLLEVLAAPPFSGRGSKKEVTLAVVERMMARGLIPPGDLEFVATGETKAENKISWGRNLLKNQGWIRSDGTRGVWELTQDGQAAAQQSRRRLSLPGR
jgi:hypothetical protein